MVSRTTSLLDSLHTTKAVASYSMATEILCERAEPEFRCRRGPWVRTLDRQAYRGTGPAPRFRTIQGWPKDQPIPPC
jgi:hypothetical protein